jgi:hypothetical protein
MLGNTFVNDAAASTVGRDPLELDPALAVAEELVGDAAADCDPLELEVLLLPHAATSAEAPITITVAEKRRDQAARTRILSLSNARILASYKNHGIQAGVLPTRASS